MEEGIMTYTCESCGDTETINIPRTAHNYIKEQQRDATCTENGYLISVCRICNDRKKEEIPATDHVKRTLNERKPTCKEEGYTGDVCCRDCGTLMAVGQVIPKTEHVWNDGKITTSSTCTTEGIKTYTCSSCGTTKTEAIAATGHGATEIRNKRDASVTSEGYTGDTYCTICNQKLSSGNAIAKLTPQTATPGKTVKDKSTNGVYKVLMDGVSVEFTKPVYKKASVRIPDAINVDGITCKVTGISANALSSYFQTAADGTITAKGDAPIVYDAVGLATTLDPTQVTSTQDITGALKLSLHVGADATSNNQITLSIDSMSAKGLGVSGLKVDGADDKNALGAIETIKEAIQKVSTQRSALGAVQNRLEHTINNLDNVVENTTSAESQIRDTDMATEMVKYSNNNILSQAGQAMLAQANQANQGVLSLLQ